MAADNKLELVIQVDAAGANASIKSVNKSLSGLEKEAVSSAKGASKGIDGMTLSMTKAVVAGNAIYDVAKRAVAALKDFTLGAIQTQDEMGKTAQKLGLTVKEFSELRHIAELSGIEVVQLGTVIGILSKNMLAAAQGSKEQREKFTALGVEFKNQDGTLRSANVVLEDIADRFQQMPDSATKTALSLALLGRSGKEMIPFLNQGGAGLRSMREEAGELGRVIDEKTFRAAEHFRDNLTRLRGAVEGLAFKVSEELLPSLIRFTDRMVQWVRDVDMQKLAAQIRDVAEWLKNLGLWIASYYVVARLIEVANAIRSVALATGAMNLALLANPWGLAAAGVATFGVVLWNEKKKLDQMNEALTETNKQAAIFAALRQGKKLEELKAAGFSEEDIRSAVTGSRKTIPGASPEFAPEGFKQPDFRIVSEEDQKRAEQIQKFMNDATRAAREFRRSVEESLAVGPAKAVLDVQKEVEKLTTFVDDKGVETRLQLTADARLNIEKALQLKIQALNKETSEQIIKAGAEEFHRRLDYDTQLYQRKLDYELDLAQRAGENARQLLAFQEERAGVERDAQLRQLESSDGQTLEQKVALEARKADIEVQYLKQVHEVKTALFDLETTQLIAQLNLQKELLQVAGQNTEQISRMISDIENQRKELRGQLDEQTQAAIDAARENAAIRQGQIVRDEQRRIFDSLKRQAEGVFDALVTKSRSVFGAIGDAFKTAMLTAIKEVVTSQVARLLMQLFGGLRLPVAGGAAAGGGLGTAGALASIAPIFTGGGFGIPGIGPGGTAPTFPTGGGGAGGFGAGLAGFLPGLKSFLGIGGSIQTGAGAATTFGAATMSQKLGAIGRSNAALLGGGLLAMAGLQRGGLSGLGMTTAGGALIGFKFGGPLGAAIGAGIGAIAGTIRLFVKSAEDKAREKIKATYGVEIKDKGVLRQIVEMAKQGFGGNLDMAIRSQQVRDLIELYAMTTGQSTGGLPAKVSPVSLVQTGGSLFQQTGFSRGSPLPPIGLDRISAG